jgi:HCOMODA/2-hydroxy-3-carboxy-muconic semialdehyde decarboxylase
MKRRARQVDNIKLDVSSRRLAEARTPKAAAALVDDLVTANYILARHQILDGYGHVSVRFNNSSRYLLSRSLAPALVTASDIQEYDLNSNPLDSAARPSFIERFIHGEIYRARPDVQAVVHSHMPSVIPFGVTGMALKPLCHMAAFLGEGVPVFEIRTVRSDSAMPMLVHNPALARSLAATLSAKPAALMRGHGIVVVGSSLPHVVGRSVYLALNATLQLQTLAFAPDSCVNYLDSSETPEIPDKYQRSWELWKSEAH